MSMYLSMEKQFFPIKNWFGGDHKRNGITIDGNEVTFAKAEGYTNRNASFRLADVDQIVHVAKFKFMFLVIVYTYEFLHSIAFIAKDGQVLATLPVQKIKAKHLLALLQTMKNEKPAIKTDVPITKALAQQSLSPINNAYYKIILRGMKWWVISFAIIVGSLITLGIIGSQS